MSGLVRVSVSVDSDLLERIDQLCDERHYASRSDAFRLCFTRLSRPPPGKQCSVRFRGSYAGL